MFLVSFMIIISGITGCARNTRLYEFTTTEFDGTMIRDGWVDENTLRVVGVGRPFSNSQIISTRRNESAKAARTAARMKIEKTIIEPYQAALARASREHGRQALSSVKRKVIEPLEKGKVLKEIFEDNDVCKVLYEVKGEKYLGEVTGGMEVDYRHAYSMEGKENGISNVFSGMNRIGSVSTKHSNLEIVIRYKNPSDQRRVGEMVYIDVDGAKAEGRITFPMMTLAKCRLVPKDAGLFGKVKENMAVYK